MRYYSKISTKLKTLGLTTLIRLTEMESFGFCIIGILISYLLHVIGILTFRRYFSFRTSNVVVRSEHPLFFKKSSLLR
jgi:hypothetical protein